MKQLNTILLGILILLSYSSIYAAFESPIIENSGSVADTSDLSLDLVNFESGYSCYGSSASSISLKISGGTGPYNLNVTQYYYDLSGDYFNENFLALDSLSEGDTLEISLPVFDGGTEYQFYVYDINECEGYYYKNISYPTDANALIYEFSSSETTSFSPFHNSQDQECEILFYSNLAINVIGQPPLNNFSVTSDNPNLNISVSIFDPIQISLETCEPFEGNLCINYGINCKDVFPVSVSEASFQEFANMVGIEDILNASAHIYPNPNKGDFVLELTSDFQEAEIVVYDAVGKTVAHQKTVLGNRVNVLLDSPKSGVYLIEIVGENGRRELVKMVVF